MTQAIHTEPTILVIFGASGDLTWRKLVPALYNLFLDGYLPDPFAVIGMGRKEMTNGDFRQHMKDGVDQCSRRGQAKADTWNEFAAHLSFLSADLGDPATYTALEKQLTAHDQEWGTRAQRILYQATPPSLVETVVQQLGKAQLARDR